MSNDTAAMIAQLQAQLEALAKGTDEGPSDSVAKPSQFASLGFVVVGNGTAPNEGDILQVPTKAGKLARVRVLSQVDTSPYETEANKHEWAFTYKRIKRGES